MKVFNTTANCVPEENYMVDISQRLKEIKKMVDEKKYFTINRARQYGKTTTLAALRKYLASEYVVISLDFQMIGNAGFATEESFVQEFCRLLKRATRGFSDMPDHVARQLAGLIERKENRARLAELFDILTEWCHDSAKPLVLMIDEVDTATNNQVFLDFLAQLRAAYIERRSDPERKTFQSVILAGVTDVKHLKAKIRPDEAHRVNSPRNIAADFDIDMSLSAEGIRDMLEEYEADHHTGMDTKRVADYIEKFTSCYPYLVSRICQLIDARLSPERYASLSEAWTIFGVDEAIKLILADGDNPLFGSIMGKLENYPTLRRQLRGILMKGDVVPWNPYDEEQSQLRMYGFITNRNNTVAIANRIFEMLLDPYFLSETTENDDFRMDALRNKSIFINADHTLNMPLILDHFVETQHRIHAGDAERFLESEGRERFLTYLAPIINGTGTWSIEEQTRDQLRMDVVIHYSGQRYIVELKIWRGKRYHEDGEKQIMEYLDRFDLNTGYMVSFNFNQNKEPGVKRVTIGDKTLFEATV